MASATLKQMARRFESSAVSTFPLSTTCRTSWMPCCARTTLEVRGRGPKKPFQLVRNGSVLREAMLCSMSSSPSGSIVRRNRKRGQAIGASASCTRIDELFASHKMKDEQDGEPLTRSLRPPSRRNGARVYDCSPSPFDLIPFVGSQSPRGECISGCTESSKRAADSIA
jgi:hypothetical protein